MTERAARGPRLSLSARLTLWYAVSAFALVLAATGVLYRGLSAGLAREDTVLLGQNVGALRRELAGAEGLDDLREAMRAQAALPGGPWLWMRLVGPGGEVLARTRGMDRLLPPRLFPAPVGLDELPPGAVSVRSPSGRWFRVASARLRLARAPRSAALQIAVSMDSDVSTLTKFRRRLWAILGAALLACAAVGYAIARGGVAPVRAMAATAARIGSQSLNERLPRRGLPAELDHLAASLNAMLEGLEDAFGRLERFSADIAHELRTPLQNLRVETEVALSRDRSPGEVRELLGSCLEEYQRLGTLIDRLLFLARVERPGAQLRREEFDLARELGVLAEFYGAAAAEAGLTLAVEAAPGVRLRADRALFQRAVGNLVENALAHTPRGGRVLLGGSEAAGGGAEVRVSDTGAGMEAADAARAFERFFRADPARARSSGGAGLGLAIVRGILTLHGGTARLESAPGRGTRVILRFPV